MISSVKCFFFFLLLSPCKLEKKFKCAGPGLFSNPASCSSFYNCDGVRPGFLMSCPPGLVWNEVGGHCDFPRNTHCRQPDQDNTISEAESTTNYVKITTTSNPTSRTTSTTTTTPSSFAASTISTTSDSVEEDPKDKYLYLTFDDGPNVGTPSVLDALKEVGVKATFFINSYQVEDRYNPYRRSVVRLVREGHMIADHSYNHMSHNSPGTHYNAYQNPLEDLTWFGEKNSKPVADILRESGIVIKHQTFILKYFQNYLF